MLWQNVGIDLCRLSLALVLGGVIGIQREMAGHEAGLRTNALVCVGSALAMLVSIEMKKLYGGDAGRIAAQVVSGIGFLGAGTIIRTGMTVRGLTTAAGLWTIAGIGLAVGVGLYAVAILATIFCLLIMMVMEWMEVKKVSKKKYHLYHLELTLENYPDVMETITQEIQKIDSKFTIKEVCYRQNDSLQIKILLRAEGNNQQNELIRHLEQNTGVKQMIITN